MPPQGRHDIMMSEVKSKIGVFVLACLFLLSCGGEEKQPTETDTTQHSSAIVQPATEKHNFHYYLNHPDVLQTAKDWHRGTFQMEDSQPTFSIWDSLLCLSLIHI